MHNKIGIERAESMFDRLAQPVLAPVIELSGVLSKRPYVRTLSGLLASLAVFQMGAVLGRARRDKSESLSKLISMRAANDNERESIAREFRREIEEATKEELENYRNNRSHDPYSFFDYFRFLQGPKFDEAFGDPKALKSMTKEKARLHQALDWINFWGVNGVGLGITYPELVEQLWRKSYETPDDHWDLARSAGLQIPAHQELLPLEEMERAVVSDVIEYARQYVPDVVEDLELP